MNTKHLLTLLLTLGVASTAMAAPQGGSKKKNADAPKAAKTMAAAPARAPYGVVIAVSGLTAQNAEQTGASLTGLVAEAFGCAKCKTMRPIDGTCKGCGGELQAGQIRPIKKAEPSVDKGSIALTIEPNARVGLAQIEGMLKAGAVHVDTQKVVLAGASTLHFANADAQSAEQIEKTLSPALFSAAKTRFDAATGKLEVDVTAGKEAPTRAAVEAAVQKAGARMALTDVVFRPAEAKGQAKPAGKAKGAAPKQAEPKKKKKK